MNPIEELERLEREHRDELARRAAPDLEALLEQAKADEDVRRATRVAFRRWLDHVREDASLIQKPGEPPADVAASKEDVSVSLRAGEVLGDELKHIQWLVGALPGISPEARWALQQAVYGAQYRMNHMVNVSKHGRRPLHQSSLTRTLAMFVMGALQRLDRANACKVAELLGATALEAERVEGGWVRAEGRQPPKWTAIRAYLDRLADR